MPILKSGIQFTGTFGNVTAYSLPGSDRIYIRTKGGHSKSRMLADPAFELSLENASEFSGCSKAAGMVRHALAPVEHLRAPGFNINAQAIKIIKKIQKLDTESERGKRVIRFSKHKQMFAGFNLHPAMSFDNIITTPFDFSIDREQGLATIRIPALQPGINFRLPWNNPMYQFIFHLSVLRDMDYSNDGYCLPGGDKFPYASTIYTGWQFSRNNYEGQTFTLQLNDMKHLTDRMTLLLSVGIEMGIQVADTVVETVKNAGCAKVVRLA